jgi:flavorubredoxin
MMKPLEIAKDVYSVGTIDWNIRDFHGYSTYQGTTYNAFLIMDEKITLIDAVKKPFADELLYNISQIVTSARLSIPKRSITWSATTRNWITQGVLKE